PQRPFKAGEGAAFFGQQHGGFDGMVADDFHAVVGKLHGGIGGVGDLLFVQCVLETHDAESHGAVLDIGVLRRRYTVVVDVDDVVEHAYGSGHGLLQLFAVQALLGDMV